MKKVIITAGIIGFVIMLILSSCTKTNVKFGNSRIIGTWKVTYEKSVSIGEGTSNYVYATNDCGYDNYNTSYTEIDSVEIIENTVKSYSSYSETYGTETNSEQFDTTYTTNDTYEITFNEDGTCLIKETYRDNDGDNSYNNNSEMTGHWNWIDAYEEKTGINIVMNDDGDFDTYQTIMYIESLSKDELIFAFDMNYKYSGESTNMDNGCYNDVTYEYDYFKTTRTYTGNNSATGNRTMTKMD